MMWSQYKIEAGQPNRVSIGIIERYFINFIIYNYFIIHKLILFFELNFSTFCYYHICHAQTLNIFLLLLFVQFM